MGRSRSSSDGDVRTSKRRSSKSKGERKQTSKKKVTKRSPSPVTRTKQSKKKRVDNSRSPPKRKSNDKKKRKAVSLSRSVSSIESEVSVKVERKSIKKAKSDVKTADQKHKRSKTDKLSTNEIIKKKSGSKEQKVSKKNKIISQENDSAKSLGTDQPSKTNRQKKNEPTQEKSSNTEKDSKKEKRIKKHRNSNEKGSSESPPPLKKRGKQKPSVSPEAPSRDQSPFPAKKSRRSVSSRSSRASRSRSEYRSAKEKKRNRSISSSRSRSRSRRRKRSRDRRKRHHKKRRRRSSSRTRHRRRRRQRSYSSRSRRSRSRSRSSEQRSSFRKVDTQQQTLMNLPVASNPATKPFRELYVGQLPGGQTIGMVIDFLNDVIRKTGYCTMPGPPIIGGWLSNTGPFCFVEFRTVIETDNALQLNDCPYNGTHIKVGRSQQYEETLHGAPKNAVTVAGGPPIVDGVQAQSPEKKHTTNSQQPLDLEKIAREAGDDPFAAAKSAANLISNSISQQKVQKFCLANIPSFVMEEKIVELLKTFGDLASFSFMKSELDELFLAVFEYQRIASQMTALKSLVGVQLGDHNLDVLTVDEAIEKKMFTINSNLNGDMFKHIIPSRCLYLKNLVEPKELEEDAEFTEILEDVNLECARFGDVLNLVIPRADPGLGYAFVEFSKIEDASKAKRSMNNRKFGANIVEANFFSEVLFVKQEWGSPQPNTDRPAEQDKDISDSSSSSSSSDSESDVETQVTKL